MAHELVALDAICNERAVICLMEGDPATALDVLRDLQDVTPPVDFPAYAFVEAHLLAGIAHLDLGDRNASAAAAEAALAAAEPDRLIFPFAMTDAAEMLDALPRHETAHGALLADIVDLLRGEPVTSMDREFLSQPEELSPGELINAHASCGSFQPSVTTQGNGSQVVRTITRSWRRRVTRSGCRINTWPHRRCLI